VEARLDALPFGLPGAPADPLVYSEILYYISDRDSVAWIGWSPRCGRAATCWLCTGCCGPRTGRLSS